MDTTSSVKRLRVLEIGGGPKPQVMYGFPDAEIVALQEPGFNTEKWRGVFDDNYVDELETYYHDTVAELVRGDAAEVDKFMEAEQFDVVFSSHVLEHFPYWQTDEVLGKWAALAKPGGQVHTVVPSAEWAARQLLAEKPSKALMGHLHGGIVDQYDIHLCSFTLLYLRVKYVRAGLEVIKAITTAYPIMAGGVAYEAEQHYVVGLKSAKEENDGKIPYV